MKIRRALGDSSESPRFLETVAGKGYRFIAPVEVLEESPRKSYPGGRDLPKTRSEPRQHNLTAQLTSFVGRQQELVELRGVLASSRILSLTGAGGVGKTQIALRLVREFLNDFPDGVWLVDLAPLSLHDLVAQTVSTVLCVKEIARAIGARRPHRQLAKSSALLDSRHM